MTNSLIQIVIFKCLNSIRKRMQRKRDESKPSVDVSNDEPENPNGARENTETGTVDSLVKTDHPTKKKFGFKSKENSENHSVSKGDNLDLESGLKVPLEKKMISEPLTVLEPARTDPLVALKLRHKKLDRVQATLVPEIHLVGQVISGSGIIQDSTEGACCR
jgi:hypothetical protein